MKRIFILIAAILVLCVGAQVQAAGYPDRPIDLIVPWGAGGGADQLGRSIGPALEKVLKVNLPVINIPGAISGVGLAKVQAARKDGYTISVFTADAVGADSQGKLAVHVKDFIPLARLMFAPSFLFVHYDSPMKTFDDLIAYTKKNPDTLKVAITGSGSPDDLTVKYLHKNGIKMISVPYPKPGERYASVLGKHNEVLYEQAGDVAQFILAKKMKPLVVFLPKRVESMSDIPAIKEFGLEIYLSQYRGLLTNQGVSPERVDVLAKAIKEAYDSPAYQKFLKKMYCLPDSYMGPEEFGKFIADDLDAYQKLWE
jgi:tripartite-type tricarboxylate transporter receptor subunit TctC